MSKLIKVNEICYECNGVRVSEVSADTYKINFLNGSVTINLNPANPIALGTGCGSGKTTAFCLIMLLRMNRGVIYVTNRTDDLDRVYQWFMENVVGQVFLDYYGQPYIFSKNDIFNLHNNTIKNENGNILNGADVNLFNKDKWCLSNKKVLLATSHKFTHEGTIYLTAFNPNGSGSQIPSNKVSMQEMGMTGITSSINLRSTLLIDELMNCEPLMATFNITDLRYMGRRCDYQFNGQIIASYQKYPCYDQFDHYYQDVIRNDRKKRVSMTDPTKNALIGGVIFNDYDRIVRDATERGENWVTVINNFKEFIFKHSKIAIVMAEGTAEFLMLNTIHNGVVTNKSNFSLVTYPNKYSSPVNIFRFDYPLKDRYIKEADLDDIKKNKIESSVFVSNMNKLADNLNCIIDLPEVNRALIFTWMNFKLKDEGFKKDNGNNLLNYSFNEEFRLTDWLKDRVIPKSIDKQVVFSHYQSGKDKATNDYRNYDTIIFSGFFRIPDIAVARMNSYYGYNCTPESYILHQVIQAVCRTRIRLHRGQPINIFFSSDWPKDIIEKVRLHLTNVGLNLNVIQKDTTLDWIKNKWKEPIKKLMDYDPGFKNAIETKSDYILNISLDEIYKLVPMSRKKSDRYRHLQDYLLSDLHIKLSII